MIRGTFLARAFAALLLAFCFAVTLNVSGAHAADVKAIDAGEDHTCAVSDGTVKCWGANDYGQIGDPATAGLSGVDTDPFTVPGITNATAVAGGSRFTCAVDGGAVKCWGRNDFGQIGDPATAGLPPAGDYTPHPHPTPFTVPGITNATAVAAGYDHACAIDGGAVKCWGRNFYWELGNGSENQSDPHPTPFTVPGITTATALAAGDNHTCVIDGGLVKCWGDDSDGQLGDPGNFQSRTPDPFTVPGITNATSVGAGWNHTCAVDGGAVKCWGANDYGQLADPWNTASRTDPFTVPGITNATAVSASSGADTCAVDGGTVKCWGYDFGKTPASIPGLAAATAVSTGVSDVCALDGGEAKCWNAYNWNPYTVDITAPDAPTVTAPDDSTAINDNTPTFKADTEPGATVAFTVDGTDVGSGTADSDGHASFTAATALDDGDHSVKATATDAAGNVSDVSAANTFTVDTQAPDTPELWLPDGDGTVTNDSSARLVITGEPDTSAHVLVDGTYVGGPVPMGTAGVLRTYLMEGEHAVTVSVIDAAGNSSDAATVHYTFDTKAPDAPTLTAPADGAFTNDTTPTLKADSEPGATVTFTLDGTDVGTASADSDGHATLTPGDALTDGQHTLKATATDAADNTSAASDGHTFTVDTAKPAAPALPDDLDGGTATKPAAPSKNPTPTLTLTGEPNSTMEVRVDGELDGTVAFDGDGTASYTLGRLSDGEHTLTLMARDRAGNESESSAPAYYRIDTAAPAAVTFGQTPARQSAQASATFAFTGEPGAQLQCSLDGGRWNACTSPLNLTGLTDGPHTLRVRATDTADNTSAPAPYAWTVTTPKTSTSLSPDPNPTPGTNPTPGPKPKTSRATRVSVPLAKKTTVAHGRAVTVGCHLNAGALARCQVALYAHGKRIGRATRRVHGTHRTTVVHVNLSARGRRLLGRARHGLRVTAKVLARSRDGRTLRHSAKGRLYRPTAFTVPAHFGAKPDRSTARLVRGIAHDIRGAKKVTCEGYTDSRGRAAHNRRVALRRARAVCAALRKSRVGVRMRSVSYGETRPVASNRTAKGRRTNQRVLVRVSY